MKVREQSTEKIAGALGPLHVIALLSGVAIDHGQRWVEEEHKNNREAEPKA